MPKTKPKGPDLLALAMRRARDDVAQGWVPKRPPDDASDEHLIDEEPLETSR